MGRWGGDVRCAPAVWVGWRRAGESKGAEGFCDLRAQGGGGLARARGGREGAERAERGERGGRGLLEH